MRPSLRWVTHFRPREELQRTGVCDGAFVHSSAQLASDVDIHPGARISEGVTIGRGSTLHSGVQIMPGCIIGEQVTIYPNAVLYEDTRVGDRSIIHAGAVLGAFGFGYKHLEDKHVLGGQLGIRPARQVTWRSGCLHNDRSWNLRDIRTLARGQKLTIWSRLVTTAALANTI